MSVSRVCGDVEVTSWNVAKKKKWIQCVMQGWVIAAVRLTDVWDVK